MASLILASTPLERKLIAVTYSIKNGLPSTQINALLQDSRGYIWIGTNSGLTRYDGSTFKTFSLLDGLPNNWVTSIAEDPREPGTLVIGTIQGGISRLQDDSLRTIIVQGSVNTLAVDRLGTIWTVLNDTLFRFDSDGLRFVSTSPTPSTRSDILLKPDMGVIVTMGRSVKSFDESGKELSSLEICTKPEEQIYSLTQDRRGRLWAVTTGWAVVCLSGQRILSRRVLPRARPFFCVQDINGVMWLRTSRGLLAFSEDGSPDEEDESYGISDTHPGDWVGPVMIDREESMWIGTWSEGLLKVTDGLVATLSATHLRWGMRDPSGHLWFDRSGVLVEMYLDAHGSWHSEGHRIPGTAVTHAAYPLFADSASRLWVALKRADSRVELRCLAVHSTRGQPSHLEEKDRLTLPIADFQTMMIDGNRHVWVAFREGGVGVFDITGREIRRFAGHDGLGPAPVRVLFRDRRGSVWIGTWAEGLGYISEGDLPDGHLRFISTTDGLPDDGIRSMYEDGRGTLWIGTRYGGVLALRGEERKVFSVHEGLLSNSIWDIEGDEQGVIWLATDAGLERIDAITGKSLPMIPEFLGYRAERIGTIHNQFVWALAGEGVVSTYDFRNRHPKPVPPPVRIVAFRVNGDAQRLGEPMEFPYDRSFCDIEFTGITFRNEAATRYVYRMLGADSLWTKPTGQRSVTYASLRPGKYTFELRAINADGVKTDESASLSFTILPPLWQRWWFIGSCLIFSGFAVYGAVRYRINKLLEVERLRTRIATDLHDDIGSGLTHIAILSDKLARQTSTSRSPTQAEVRSSRETIHNVGVIARELHDSMGDIVWSIDGSKDSFGDLLERMKFFAFEICESDSISLAWDNEGIDVHRRLSPLIRRSILLIAKEALTNIVRHAGSTSVRISLSQSANRLHVKIADNGRGFDPKSLQRVNGLRNMRERAEKLGGAFNIQSAPGNGTTVEAAVPL